MKNLQRSWLIVTRRKSLLVFTLVLLLGGCKNSATTSVIDEKFEGDGDNLERITQVMVPPPMLPKFDQADKDNPKVVQVTFTVQEKKIEVALGDSIWAFTYLDGGSKLIPQYFFLMSCS